MITILEKVRFRIQIYDIKKGKSRTISLIDNDDANLDDIAKKIRECVTKELK